MAIIVLSHCPKRSLKVLHSGYFLLDNNELSYRIIVRVLSLLIERLETIGMLSYISITRLS